MNDVALDASVVLKWFRDEGERHVREARAFRTAYEAGELTIFVPSLLHLEILNVAGLRWHLAEDALVALASALAELGFELIEPPIERVARWIARGLTAYDAAYVAVAEAADVKLVSDDDFVVELAVGVAEPLAATS